MKQTRKILSFVLALSMLITMLVSCTGSDNKKDDDKNNENNTNVDVDTLINIKDYKIVHPKRCVQNIEGVSRALKNEIKEYTKADIAVVDESEAAQELEILIGLTERKESTALYESLTAKVDKQAYAIKIDGKKIVIVGATDDDTILAVRCFMNEFVEKSQAEGYLALEKDAAPILQKTGKVLFISRDFRVVVQERYSTVYSPSLESVQRFTYGKIVKLEHQSDEKNNGVLLASNEIGTPAPWPIYRSMDDGKNWEKIATIKDTINPNVNSGYQPYLYELPEDMGKYKKGTVLFTGCSYQTGETNIFIYSSTDLGKTWSPIGNVAEGNGYNGAALESDAIWEPYLIYEESTKRMYCFYSDEMDDNHNQRLVYRYSTDLVNWSETYSASALGTKLRPGMVSVTKMGNGKYAMIGEMVGYQGGGNWVHIKFADTLDGWDVDDPGTPVTTNASIGCGGAPMITWTPDGGECGTLIIVAHHNIRGTASSPADMFLSFDYGKTWTCFTNPIPVGFNDKTYNGYSNGLFTDKDGNVYYVNNIDLYKGAAGEKLMMCKLKIY